MSLQRLTLENDLLTSNHFNPSYSKRILLLCHAPSVIAETIYEHITAFEKCSRNHIVTCSIFGEIPEVIPLDKFDVVVIHYSLCIGRGGFLSLAAKRKIRNYKGYKVLFIQDDYRWVYSTVTNCYFMGIKAIFGLVEQKMLYQVYPNKFLDSVYVETVLTGYVSQKMLKEKAIDYNQRNIDVSYRARKLPFWMGSHTLQKWQIAEKFISDAEKYQLVFDISIKEEDRLYGQAWSTLLKHSKATLGTESGTNICDFTGKLQSSVEAFLIKHPKASFESVKEMFFQDEKNNVLMNVISPRIFEAISHKVLLVLYPGNYSGVLKPWRHYVPLKTDHSNIEEVISVIRSSEKAQKIIQCAYQEVLCNPEYQYQSMIDKFDAHITKTFKDSPRLPSDDVIWHFDVASYHGSLPQTSDILLMRKKLGQLRRGELSIWALLRYICGYLKLKLSVLKRSLCLYKCASQKHPNTFNNYLTLLKQEEFLACILESIDLNTNTCHLFCALQLEKRPIDISQSYKLEAIEPDSTLKVYVHYTKYAEAFLDSIDDFTKMTTIQMKRESLLSMIS